MTKREEEITLWEFTSKSRINKEWGKYTDMFYQPKGGYISQQARDKARKKRKKRKKNK